LINKLYNCARVRNEMIYRGEKLGWCATSGAPCICSASTETFYSSQVNSILAANCYSNLCSEIS